MADKSALSVDICQLSDHALTFPIKGVSDMFDALAFWARYYRRQIFVVFGGIVVVVGGYFLSNSLQDQYFGGHSKGYWTQTFVFRPLIDLGNWLVQLPRTDLIGFFSALAAGFSAWAAIVSANSSRRSLYVNRPWVVIEEPKWRYDTDAAQFVFLITARNFGQSVALDVNLSSKFGGYFPQKNPISIGKAENHPSGIFLPNTSFEFECRISSDASKLVLEKELHAYISLQSYYLDPVTGKRQRIENTYSLVLLSAEPVNIKMTSLVWGGNSLSNYPELN